MGLRYITFFFYQVGLAVGEVSNVIEEARITTIKQRVKDLN